MPNAEDLVNSIISTPQSPVLCYLSPTLRLPIYISDITLVKVDWATIKQCDPILFVLK